MNAPSSSRKNTRVEGLDTAVVEASVEASVEEWKNGQRQQKTDQIAREVAIALVYNEVSHAVMMVSPRDLEAFALGFSLSEAIVDSPDDVYDIQLQQRDEGIEIALNISSQCFNRLKDKRRSMTGRTGCGLCGAESLQQARLAIEPVISAIKISHRAIERASVALNDFQPLQKETGAVHGAAWCDKQGNHLQVCEDVGRHNALDKLIGSMAQQGKLNGNPEGFLLISSRASYEMIQKAARAGFAVVAAVSAPTSLAIDYAKELGITLLGFSRAGRHVCYSHGERLKDQECREKQQ